MNRTIMEEITTRQLAELENKSQIVIIWRCRNRFYTLTRKVKGRAGGDKDGQSWLIDINDPRISEAARTKYYLKNYIIHLAEKIIDEKFKELNKNVLKLSEDARQAREFMNNLQGKCK